MSSPRIDLRPKAPARASQERIGPLPAGTIINKDTPLTARERQQMAKLGQVQLPPAVSLDEPGEVVAKVAALPGTMKRPIADLQLPKEVDINELPAEKQEEILKGLEQARAMFNAPIIPRAEPASPKLDIKSSTKGYTPPATLDPPPQPMAVKSDTPSAVADKEPMCPHCGWDQRNPDPPAKVEDNDKLVFLQSVLGRQRFVKTYQLFNGAVTVVFRTLTTAESDLCWKQATHDAEVGLLVEPTQFLRTVNDYRMCLGLMAIDYGNDKLDLPRTLDDWTVPDLGKGETKLKYIVNYLYDNVLVQESVRKACGVVWYRFQRFVEHLENHLDDSNFWPAIGGQR